MYEDALRTDRRLLELRPQAIAPRRRRLWSLIRLDRADDALAEAEAFDRIHGGTALADPFAYPLAHQFAHQLAEAARRYAALSDRDEAARLALSLPVLEVEEARVLRAGIVPPEARRPER
jgi:hypothetical protein